MQVNLLVCAFVCERETEIERERQSVREMYQTIQDGHLWGWDLQTSSLLL